VCQSGLLESAAKSSKSRRETAQGSVSIRVAWICSKIFKITKRNCPRQWNRSELLEVPSNLQNQSDRCLRHRNQSDILEVTSNLQNQSDGCLRYRNQSGCLRCTAIFKISQKAVSGNVIGQELWNQSKSGGIAPARRTRCLYEICWCLVDCIPLTSNTTSHQS
jgi:hypothetical protein